MGMKRRIFSLLLCAAMILSLLPTTVFAAEAPAKYTITVNGGKAYSDYSARFELTEAEAGQTVVLATSGIDFVGWEVVSPTELTISGGTMTSFTMPASNVVVTAKHSETPAAKTYDVWVNGVQFTEDQLTVACGDGTATYDPDTNTVTLNNATITGAYSDDTQSGSIYSTSDLNVKFIGENRITPPSVPGKWYAIYANKDITISGDGKLVVSAIGNSKYGIHSENGNVTITDDSNLDIALNVYMLGIHSGKNTIVSGNGAVTITSSANATGVRSNGDITISGSAKVTSAPFVCQGQGNVIFSGSGDVQIIGNGTQGPNAIRLYNPTGKVLLNGTAATITLKGRDRAVTGTNSVAGTNFDNYEVTGDPASASVVYTFKGNSYDVWVGGVQVTDANKDNVLGDGTATYNPDTNTLTLDGAQITSAYDGGAIRAKGALTVNVAGDSSITLDSSTDAHGIFAEGNLTLTGPGNLDIRVEADECDGLEAWDDITLSGSGDVTIHSECNNGVFSVMGKLILSGSGNVDIYGEGAGCYGENMQVLLNGTGSSVKLGGGYKSVNNDDGASIVAGANFDKYEATGDPASTSVTYMYKVAIPYGVWVNGEQFTSKQLTIPCGTGTATYDPDTNTVTLNNATITKAYNDGTQSSGIYASDALTVELVGENRIEPTSGTWSAIYADKDIAIIGDGTLNVSTLISYTSGIKSKTGNVSISVDDTAKITIMVMLDGIFSGMNTIISGNGTVDVTSNEATGLLSNGGVTITSSGNVAFRGHSRGIASYNGNVIISGSGDVVIAGNAGSDGIYLGQGDLILSGSGKKVYIAGSIGTTAAAVRFGPENEGQVLLNGTASPITLKGAKEAVSYHGASPVAGTNFNKYNADGDPASTSVVYTYTGICTHPNTELRGFVAPTCKAEGCSGDIYCKDCGMQLAASMPMEKLEHDYEQTATYDPTCTEDGYGEMTCKYCGDKFTFKMYDAFNHPAYETIPGKAATCTETGLTEGKKCVVCGEILEAQEVIPAKGHHYVGDTCDVCGYSKPSTTLLGDVNNDGRVNQKDVARLRQYIADGTTYPLDAQQNADVNKDGKINQKDVARLRQYIADPATYPLG